MVILEVDETMFRKATNGLNDRAHQKKDIGEVDGGRGGVRGGGDDEEDFG